MSLYRNDPKLFVYQDMIGVELHAKHKYNPTWKEFKFIGVCIDESKNSIQCQFPPNPSKTYIKDQFIFKTWLPQANGQQIVLQFDGQKILGKPEQRIKLIRKSRRKLH